MTDGGPIVLASPVSGQWHCPLSVPQVHGRQEEKGKEDMTAMASHPSGPALPSVGGGGPFALGLLVPVRWAGFCHMVQDSDGGGLGLTTPVFVKGRHLTALGQGDNSGGPQERPWGQ